MVSLFAASQPLTNRVLGVSVVTALSLQLLSPSSHYTYSMAMATAMSTTAVPSRMQLSESVRDYISQNLLYKAKLSPLSFQSSAVVEGKEEEPVDEVVTELTESKVTLQEAAIKNSGKAGSVAFIVRRPG